MRIEMYTYDVLGIPLLPTLGSPVRSLNEVYTRLGSLEFTAEYKYDGQRAQIHAIRDDGGQVSVKIFSRHLEDMTGKVKCPSFLISSDLTFLTSSIPMSSC